MPDILKKVISQIRKDFSIPALAAGLIVVLVGISSSVVLVFQSAKGFGLDSSAASSWLGSLCVMMGILTIGLSLRFKAPILIAWSTPVAALLASGSNGSSLSETIGAFLFSAALIFLAGITGVFEKVMNKIPLVLAQALLAGVLLKFCLSVFTEFAIQPFLLSGMCLCYLIGRKLQPRLTMLFVLGTGVVLAGGAGSLRLESIHLTPTQFTWFTPSFSWNALLSLGVPMFIITMTSQNMTGIAVMRANGYRTPISTLISWTGFGNLLTAPFGGFAINLAAVTAAIGMGPEAHADPKRRYIAALVAGFTYILVGFLAGTVTSILSAFPAALVVGIAGLALLSTVANALHESLKVERQKEAAFITFIVAASGVSFFGVGSAFWAILAGIISQFILRTKSRGT